MPARRPTERNTQLGQVLRTARREAGLNQTQAAKRLETSQPTIARLESAEKVPTRDELRRVIECYDPSQQLREEIERLARPEEQDTPALNARFDEMLGASEDAVGVRTFHSERIPMTLQCERYALKQYNLFDPSVPPVTVLRLHARRAEILTRPEPPTFQAVMTVSSLLRMPGGQLDLVNDQAQHLLHLLEKTPSLTLRVLNLDADIPFVDSDFTLLRMKDRRDDLIYVPFGLDGHTIKDRTKIEERERYWRIAHRAALDEERTLDLLRLLAEHGHETVAWSGSSRRTS